MTFRFDFSWYKKNDINEYPKVYSKAINANSSELYVSQIDNFFAPLNNRGFEPVFVSAYLDKWSCEITSEVYQYDEKRIMEHVMMPKSQNDHDVVFVWDIGDITMLPINYILELSMLRSDINATSLFMLEKRICDSFLNLEDLTKSIKRKVDIIEDVFVDGTDEMIKAAPIYSSLRKLYDDMQSNYDKEKESIIPHDLFEKVRILEHKEELCYVAEKHQEVYNQRWKTAKKCLQLVNERSAESQNKKFANVVLCDQGVLSGATQLLISGLFTEVPIENIYSTFRVCGEPNLWHRMKSVVERLQQRFGENCLFIHVSSGDMYSDIPLQKWPISANDSFDFLYNFQRDTLLQ